MAKLTREEKIQFAHVLMMLFYLSLDTAIILASLTYFGWYM